MHCEILLLQLTFWNPKLIVFLISHIIQSFYPHYCILFNNLVRLCNSDKELIFISYNYFLLLII